MQKLTEIEEQITVKKRQYVDGEETFVETNILRFREVPFVEGLPRFGHYLIDRGIIWVCSFGLEVLIVMLLTVTGNAGILENSSLVNLFDTLFAWFVVQPAYYFIFEVSMQSTPGKALLKRMVVDEYGNKPTTRQILIRSLSRTVPLEIFSCLSPRGWHDTWSRTFVLRKKDLKELRLLQKINNVNEEPVNGSEENKHDSN
jgi:uncharacterized RDD family membrane protein YckC